MQQQNNQSVVISYLVIIISIIGIFGFLQPIETINNRDMQKKFLSQGINMTYMDTTVSPKDDFYQFVNGNWIDSAKIPSDHSVWGGFMN